MNRCKFMPCFWNDPSANYQSAPVLLRTQDQERETHIVDPIELVSEMSMIPIHTICQSIISSIPFIESQKTHTFHSLTSLGVNLTSDIVVVGVEWYRLPRLRVVICRRDRPLSKEGIKSAMIARATAVRVYMILRVLIVDLWMIGEVLC